MPIQKTLPILAMIAAMAAGPAYAEKAGDENVSNSKDKVVVDVPTTRVETEGDKKTKVRVRAPYSDVDVDTRRRRVRIDVPYFNGTISW
ncbi:MAG: hypothetical protein AAGC70_03790 [Pseudomonadota bacterium]